MPRTTAHSDSIQHPGRHERTLVASSTNSYKQQIDDLSARIARIAVISCHSYNMRPALAMIVCVRVGNLDWSGIMYICCVLNFLPECTSLRQLQVRVVSQLLWGVSEYEPIRRIIADAEDVQYFNSPRFEVCPVVYRISLSLLCVFFFY